MAYTINLTDGTIFATVADGTINTSSSMVLVGKNYAGYGEFLDENFIHLLESGANTVPPGAPLTGQLWWDKANAVMKVYNGSTFKVISASTASSTQPTSNVTGDLWFDTVNQQLKVYNGTAFILVGPASTSGEGTSGAIVTTLTDNLSQDHVVIQLFVQDVLVGMISKDASFSPVPAIAGFSSVGPGLQLSTTVSNNLFRGTSSNSLLLNSISSSSFLRSDENDTTSGTLGIINDSGMTVGLDQDAKLSVTTATSEVVLQNQTQDGNLSIKVNDGGVTTTAIFVNGTTGVPAVTGLTNLNANGVGNIGSTTNRFNTVFAKATSAEYADVAERFAADAALSPGTVVEIGGIAEITASKHELSENVFGVVSTRAAYLMNSSAGDNDSHPPVAMTGRVPVRVIGPVAKGDRLVSAGNGLARAALSGEATAFNVIGRALIDKTDLDEGTVEAIVTVK